MHSVMAQVSGQSWGPFLSLAVHRSDDFFCFRVGLPPSLTHRLDISSGVCGPFILSLGAFIKSKCSSQNTANTEILVTFLWFSSSYLWFDFCLLSIGKIFLVHNAFFSVFFFFPCFSQLWFMYLKALTFGTIITDRRFKGRFFKFDLLNLSLGFYLNQLLSTG